MIKTITYQDLTLIQSGYPLNLLDLAGFNDPNLKLALSKISPEISSNDCTCKLSEIIIIAYEHFMLWLIRYQNNRHDMYKNLNDFTDIINKAFQDSGMEQDSEYNVKYQSENNTEIIIQVDIYY